MGYDVDFMAVGDGSRSGDAIAVRWGNLHGARGDQVVAIIDGGFTATGETLVAHVEQHYGTDTVDVVVSTHPDDDHTNGLYAVLEKMRVGCLVMHQPWKHTDDIARLFKDGRVTDQSVGEHLRRSLDSARGLERLAEKKGIKIVEPFQGVGGYDGALQVLGPTEKYYESLLPLFRGTPEPRSLLAKAADALVEMAKRAAENWHLETLSDDGETSAENNSSAIVLISPPSLSDKRLLFTGDAGAPALSIAADQLDTLGIASTNLRFVQVPHHGSRRNVGPTILTRLLGPKRATDAAERTAFVSAAPGGAPKHPNKKVTNAHQKVDIF